jgi:excisionase family DNA binding protein
MSADYKLPPVIMTEEEIEQSEEQSLELEREWLARHEQEQKQRKTRSKPETLSRLLRTKQAAQYIGVSEWKLRQMVYNGEIAVIRGKYWTFDIKALEKWIDAHQEREQL